MAVCGAPVPDFRAHTTRGEISFGDLVRGGWSLLFSFPAPFDPVATTNLGMLAKLHAEFAARDCKVIALSSGAEADTLAYLGEVAETQGTLIPFPVIADRDRGVSAKLSLVATHDAGANCSAILLIDGDCTLQLREEHPPSLGFNFYESIRALDALQLSEARPVETPAAWCHGDDVVVHHRLSDEQARARFPAGFATVTPYLRYTSGSLEDPAAAGQGDPAVDADAAAGLGSAVGVFGR